MAKEKKMSVETGKRKEAVARASVGAGKGKVTVNSKPLDMWATRPLQLWVREPLALAGDAVNGLDISVTVRGGGVAGQAQAVRVAISKALVKALKDVKLRERYLAYDRNLLVYDPRQTEPHKPSRSKQGARRHKQRSKR